MTTKSSSLKKFIYLALLALILTAAIYVYARRRKKESPVFHDIQPA